MRSPRKAGGCSTSTRPISSAFFEDEDDEEVADTPADLLRASAARLMQAVAQLGPSSKPETIERVCELLDGARKEIYELLAEE